MAHGEAGCRREMALGVQQGSSKQHPLAGHGTACGVLLSLEHDRYITSFADAG
jgi:hypothetical protein